jgi:hypothetical protein
MVLIAIDRVTIFHTAVIPAKAGIHFDLFFPFVIPAKAGIQFFVTAVRDGFRLSPE